MNYNGWIWAPFEKIAVALGKDARWDGDTNTLYLEGQNPVPTRSFIKAVPPVEVRGASTLDSVKMGGNTYPNALQFTLSYSSNPYSIHKLDGKYTTITGYLGHVDGTTNNNSTVYFYGDDKLVASYSLLSTAAPQKITVYVTGVKQLKISCGSNYSGGAYAFADAYIE